MSQFPKFHNPLHPESAEQDLIRLIHLKDAEEFRITIEHANGMWQVSTSVPPHQREFTSTGTGESFHAAWNSQNPIPRVKDGGEAKRELSSQAPGDERRPDKRIGQVAYADKSGKAPGGAGEPKTSNLEPEKQGGIGGP